MSNLVRILRDNGAQLSALCEQGPVELSQNLLQRYVLSDSKLQVFKSLDHSRVDPLLQSRYLLKLVSETVDEDRIMWDTFLELLFNMGERQMYNYLCELPLDDCGEVWCESDSDSDVWYDCLSEFSSIENTEKYLFETTEVRQDIYLKVEDIQWIVEELVQVSHKWEHIARALGLHPHEIENCRRSDNKLSLGDVLTCWLARDTSAIPIVTMNTLVTALRSELVGEGRMAQNLKIKYRKQSSSSLKSLGSSFKSLVSSTSIISLLTGQSYDVEVEDGKSTLLQVQASPSESVCYQWKKDGQPLANSCTYSGVDEDILVVSHASQGTEGEYTCCVSYRGREECSNKIILTVLYPPAKKRLLDLYSIHREVPPDSWPPVGAKSFINLTMIESNSNNFLNEDDDYEIISHKIKVEYGDIFGEYQPRSLVVAEGRPGSGKTTLVYKVVNDWRKGTALKKAKFVYLVTLRRISRKTVPKTLSDILKLFYDDDEELRKACEELKVCGGEGVCFIVDGLDEYCPASSNCLIYQLLNKTFLPLAMVILTSRPVALEILREEAITQRVEVLGFSKEQILEYVSSFPFDKFLPDSSSAVSYQAKLKTYLYSQPNVFNMCYLPVHAAMICYLFSFQKGDIPNTQTKIYEEFVRSIILRHLRRHNVKAQVHSLSRLRDDVKDRFNKLCHLAYIMTMNGKQVATPEVMDGDLCEYISSDSDDWCLGLVTINRMAQLSGITETYSFLHLTVQEFLTAFYITNLKNKEQMEVLSGRTVISLPVMRFYCGLAQSQCRSELENIIRTLSRTADITENILMCIGAFESQQPELCDTVGENCSGCYDNYSSVTPSDLYAMSYVILKTSYPVKEIILTSLYGNDYDYTEFFKCIDSKEFRNLQKLDLRVELHNVGILAVSNVLKTSISLHDANLTFREISHESAKAIIDNLKCLTSLQKLRISCYSTSGGITTLLKGLNCLVSTDLILDFTSMDCSGVLEISNGLKHLSNDSLYYLELRECSIDGDGAVSLASNLNPSITQLYLSNNNIDGGGVSTILKKILGLTQLRWLDLSNSNIDNDNAIILADQLTCLPFLQGLYLSCNNIGPAGAVSLANQLHSLTNLQSLDLSFNNIDLSSAIILLSKSKHSPALSSMYLNISSTHNTDDGIHIEGLVSSEDAAAIAACKAAVQHSTKHFHVHMGFDTIYV